MTKTGRLGEEQSMGVSMLKSLRMLSTEGVPIPVAMGRHGTRFHVSPTLGPEIFRFNSAYIPCAETSPKQGYLGGFMPTLGGNMQARVLT